MKPKKNPEIKKRIQGPILQEHGKNNFSGKDKSERRRKKITTERQTSTDPFTRKSSQ